MAEALALGHLLTDPLPEAAPEAEGGGEPEAHCVLVAQAEAVREAGALLQAERLGVSVEVELLLPLPHPLLLAQRDASLLGEVLPEAHWLNDEENEARPLALEVLQRDAGALSLPEAEAQALPLPDTLGLALAVKVELALLHEVEDTHGVGETVWLAEPLPLALKQALGVPVPESVGEVEGQREEVADAQPRALAVSVRLGVPEPEPLAGTEADGGMVALLQTVGEKEACELPVKAGLPLPLPLPLGDWLLLLEGVLEELGHALALLHALAVLLLLLQALTERLPVALPEKLGGLLAVPLALPLRLAEPQGLLEAHWDAAALAVRESVLEVQAVNAALSVPLWVLVGDLLGVTEVEAVVEAHGLALEGGVLEGLLEEQREAVAHALDVEQALVQWELVALLLCDAVALAQGLALIHALLQALWEPLPVAQPEALGRLLPEPLPLPLRLTLLQGLLEAQGEDTALEVLDSVLVGHAEGDTLTVPLGELLGLPVAAPDTVDCSEAVGFAVPLPQPLGVRDSSVLTVAIALPLPQPLPLAVTLPVREGEEEALGQGLALAGALAVLQALPHADGERLPEALPEVLGGLLAVELPLLHRLALLQGLLEAHWDGAALEVRESVLVEQKEPVALTVAL